MLVNYVHMFSFQMPTRPRHLKLPILMEILGLRFQLARKRAAYILAIIVFYIALLFDAPLLWRWKHVMCKAFCDLRTFHMNICL